MISRRDLFALAGLAGLAAVGTAACGSTSGASAVELVSADLPRAAVKAGVRDAAVSAVSAFTADLYGRVAASAQGNLVCSPYSVAVALGMTVQGAAGVTAAQLLSTMHGTDATSLADGLNAIDQALAARSGTTPAPNGGDPLTVELSGANSLWGQRGITWQKPFLEVLSRDFGTGMRQVDFAGATEAARRAVNAWVSDQTHARIPELVPPGAMDGLTRLALVNALYLKASWQTPFEKAVTQKHPFTRLDGSAVQADLMQTGTEGGFASGRGWVAADVPYARGELAMAVVVPDAGRFAEVEKAVDGAWLARLLTGFTQERVQIGLPRWTTRTKVDLVSVLTALGMPVAFSPQADFSGMTTQEQLQISAVLHEGFVTVDEAGTEATAATAVVAVATGAVLDSRPVIADRPFLYVIHDKPTGTPLFVGRVVDPTAT